MVYYSHVTSIILSFTWLAFGLNRLLTAKFIYSYPESERVWIPSNKLHEKHRIEYICSQHWTRSKHVKSPPGAHILRCCSNWSTFLQETPNMVPIFFKNNIYKHWSVFVFVFVFVFCFLFVFCLFLFFVCLFVCFFGFKSSKICECSPLFLTTWPLKIWMGIEALVREPHPPPNQIWVPPGPKTLRSQESDQIFFL